MSLVARQVSLSWCYGLSCIVNHTGWDGLQDDVCCSRTYISMLWVVLLSGPHWLRWLGAGQISLSWCSGLSCIVGHIGWDGLEEVIFSSRTDISLVMLLVALHSEPHWLQDRYLFPGALGCPCFVDHTGWDSFEADTCSSRTGISLLMLWVVLLSKPHWLRWLERGYL